MYRAYEKAYSQNYSFIKKFSLRHHSFALFLRSAFITTIVLVISLVFIFGFLFADYNTAKATGSDTSVSVSEFDNYKVTFEIFGQSYNIDMRKTARYCSYIENYSELFSPESRLGYYVAKKIIQ